MTLQRYGCVDDGVRPREVVLLRSMACSWGKCTFCDYCTDNVPSVARAAAANKAQLGLVTGKHGILQVIDSASWTELPMQTMWEIRQVCKEKHISIIIFEGHWMFKDDIYATKLFFAAESIRTEFIVGLESTDPDRRAALNKGYPRDLPLRHIKARGFNWCNLLYGDSTSPKMDVLLQEVRDVAAVFDYVNISIFTDNPVAGTNGIFRQQDQIDLFYEWAMPFIRRNLSNVFVFDFGDSRAPDTLGGAGNAI